MHPHPRVEIARLEQGEQREELRAALGKVSPVIDLVGEGRF